MVRDILVPLDGSEFSESSLPVAVDLARRSGAVLHLVRVHDAPQPPFSDGLGLFDPRWPERARSLDRGRLEELTARYAAPAGLQTKVRLLDAPVAAALANYVTRERIGMVVMTTHARSGLSRAWLGSVADDLVRSLTVPVLLLRPDDSGQVEAPSFDGRALLVPLDGSAQAETALGPARELARLYDAPVVLLNVMPPLYLATAPGSDAVAMFDSEWYGVENDRAATYLERMAETIADEVPAVRSVIATHAQPAVAILEAVRSTGAGIVVMATQGRAGVARWALGSVADKVIRAGDVPVLAVRPRRPRRAWAAAAMREMHSAR
jgi:nucleotide-binding universal stress UspA family protein